MSMSARSVFFMSVIVVGAFFAGAATRAQDSDDSDAKAREKKVRALLKINGTAEISKQQFDMMCDMFSANPQIPAGFVPKFKELAKPQDLVDLVVPIYAKHLDDDMIKALNDFYSSEQGKKFAKAQVGIAKDSQKAGEKWGRETAMKVIAALKEGDDENK
jgi:hypothetical protein